RLEPQLGLLAANEHDAQRRGIGRGWAHFGEFDGLLKKPVWHLYWAPPVVRAGGAEKLIQGAVVKLGGNRRRTLFSKQCGDAHDHPSMLDKAVFGPEHPSLQSAKS